MGFSWFGDLQIEGDWGKDTSSRILQADLDMSVEQVTELSFTVHDPNFEYIKAFYAGAAGSAKDSQGEKKGPLGAQALYASGRLKMAVTGFELDGGSAGQGQTVVKLQPRGVELLRKITEPYTQSNCTASDYVRRAAEGVGLLVNTMDTPSRPSIARDTPEESEEMTPEEKESAARQKNEWTTLVRLAAEEGFVIYEAFGILYFGTPHWLLTNNLTHTFGVDSFAPDDDHRIIGLPTISMSLSKDSHNEIGFTVSRNVWKEIQVGNACVIKGSVAMNDKPLVITNVRMSLAGPSTTIEVTAREPWVIPKQTNNLWESEEIGGDFDTGDTLNIDNLPPMPEKYGSEANWKRDTIRIARAVAYLWPDQITAIGGWRPSDPYPDHPSGRAADIMIKNYSSAEGIKAGNEITAFLHANGTQFGLQYTIWRQYYRDMLGTRNQMEDRGSDTQNHYDHVHATVNEPGDTGTGGIVKTGRPAKPKPTPGSGTAGPGRPNIDTSKMSIQESMIAVMKAKFPGLSVTSTSRSEPGSQHDWANQRAVDFSNVGSGQPSSPLMQEAANWIADTYPPGLTMQLIHRPFNRNIGQEVGWVGDGNGFYGPGTMQAHGDHIHWAMYKNA